MTELKMSLKERMGWATQMMLGNVTLVDVKLQGRIISSSENTTGGSGTVEILGTFGQRGYGGLQKGDIVDIGFLAIQEDSPQQFVIEKINKKEIV